MSHHPSLIDPVAAFHDLRPLHSRLVAMQGRLRPFGTDYLILEAALAGLATAAEHFTGQPDFFSLRLDPSRATEG